MDFSEKNVGTGDKIARVIIALVLALWGMMYATYPLNLVAYVIALIAVITALRGSCALYSLIGYSTCAPEAKAAPVAAKAKKKAAKKAKRSRK